MSCERTTHGCSFPISKQCPIVYGATSDPRSVRIGALFDLSGPEATIGAMQAHSSELAVEQLNAAGGVKLRGESDARPLTLVICDRALDSHAAVSTLVESLGVKALLGPAWSQSFAEVASDTAIPDDALLLGPSALSEAVGGGQRGTLGWGMTLSEADRVPMLLSQLRALADQLDVKPWPLQLALVMRADGPMTSVRISQAQLAPLDHGPMLNLQQVVSSYEYSDQTELSAIVKKLAAQPPDIIIADGATEVPGDLVAALERMLAKDAKRPYYLLGEAAQVPALLMLAEEQPALQSRVSVVAAVPTEAAHSVYSAFERAYRERYAQSPAGVTGVAASYSAVYALAYGLMAASDPLRYGAALALGLHQLTGGALSLSTGPDDVSKLSDALAAQQAVTVTGTMGELSWTDQGSPRGALVGVYCLGQTDQHWSFVSTGYRYDIASGALAGTATPCVNVGAPSTPDTSAEKATDTAPTQPKDKPADAGVREPQTQAAKDAGQPAADGGNTSQTEPTDIGLAVQYYPHDTSAFDNVVSPAIKIVNRSSSEAVPLCSLSARYYFTNEHPEACPQDCTIDSFYSGLQPSGSSTPALRRYHEADADNPSAYLEVSFPCTPIALGEGDSVEVQQQFHTEPYRDFDESDDYSYRPFPTSYADSEFLTLYHDGKLVWGRPPR